MQIELHLKADEVERLNSGGFITMILHDGIRIIVKKDETDREEIDE